MVSVIRAHIALALRAKDQEWWEQKEYVSIVKFMPCRHNSKQVVLGEQKY